MSSSALLTAAPTNESTNHRADLGSVLSICESQIDELDFLESVGQGLNEQSQPQSPPPSIDLRAVG